MIGPRRCWSACRSCSRWGCARSGRRSAPVRAAVAPPAPSSRRWPSASRPISRTRCRPGPERYPGVEDLNVAVMGCVVNGPGESKHADIGISLPGTFEEPKAPVFVDGALQRDAARRGPGRGVHRHPGVLHRAPLRRQPRRSEPGPASSHERGPVRALRFHRPRHSHQEALCPSPVSSVSLTAQSEDFPGWYNDVVLKAQLASHSPVRGCMIDPPVRLRHLGVDA